MILLSKAGDIHTNPGPYPSNSVNTTVSSSTVSIPCCFKSLAICSIQCVEYTGQDGHHFFLVKLIWHTRFHRDLA